MNTSAAIRIIIFLICPFLLSLEVFSQSTDNIKLHILFDRSGSTSISDNHANTYELLTEMLQVENEIIKSPLSFNLASYGTSNGIIKASLDIFDESDKGENRASVLSEIKKLQSVRKERFSDLLQGIDSVDKKIRINSENAGIFIFTDGIIQDGDIPPNYKDLKKYNDELQRKINFLRSSGIPVFIVQSSPEYKNDFQYDAFKLKPIITSDRVKQTKTHFWLKSDLAYERTDSVTTSMFRAFLVNALAQMVRSSAIFPEDDYLGRLIYLSDVLKLGGGSSKSDSLKFSLKRESLLKMFLDSYSDKSQGYLKEDSLLFYNAADPISTLTASLNSGLEFGGYLDSSYQFTPPPPTISDLIEKLFKLEASVDRNGWDKEQIDGIRKVMDSIIFHSEFESLIRSYQNFVRTNEREIEAARIYLTSTASRTAAAVSQLTPLEDKKNRGSLENEIILGLTDYLIERTQREAVFILYENLYQKIIKGNGFIEDTLFYHTGQTLKRYDRADATFDPNITIIKEAFNRDVNEFPNNIIKHPKIRQSDGLLTLAYSTTLINELTRGKTLEESFGEVLERLPKQSPEHTPIEKGFIFIAHFIDFLQQHDLTAAYSEISPDSLIELTKLASVYIASQYDDFYTLRNFEELSTKLLNVYENYHLAKNSIEAFKKELEAIQPNSDFHDYREYRRDLILDMLNASCEIFMSSIDLIEHFCTFEDYENLKSQVYKYRTIMKSSIDVWFSIHKGEYLDAVTVLIPMIPTLPVIGETSLKRIKRYYKEDNAHFMNDIILSNLNFVNDSNAIIRTLFNEYNTKGHLSVDSLSAFLSRNGISFLQPLLEFDTKGVIIVDNLINSVIDLRTRYSSKVKPYFEPVTLLDSLIWKNFGYKRYRKLFDFYKNENTNNQHFLAQYFQMEYNQENLRKLIGLAGEISKAETAGEVQNVLNQYALPVASYREKRKANAVMINAYVGMGYAAYPNEVFFDGDAVLSAPIGIERSWCINHKHNSLSLFFPILDVGNVIDYRINNTSESDDDVFDFEGIFSPGAYLVYGPFKRLPFSIGIGYQAFPNRYGAFVSFDLPLFRLN